MRKLHLITLSVLLTYSFAQAADSIKVSAGAAPLENIFGRIKSKFETESGMTLELNKGTHVTTLQDVEQGKADVAAVGFQFDDWIKRAEKDGAKFPPGVFKFRVIGRDNLVFVTHKGTGAKKLTNDQLKKIFLGEIKDWSEVGGAKEKIKPVIAEQLPGLNGLVKEKILGGTDFPATTTKIAGGLTELKKHLKDNAGSIAFVPTGAVDAEVTKVDAEELGRPVTAVTKGPPNPKILKLFDFLVKNTGEQAK